MQDAEHGDGEDRRIDVFTPAAEQFGHGIDDKADGDAIALIEVDEQVSEEIADKVRALPHVVRAIPLRF